MHPDLTELNHIRLHENLTYGALAKQIGFTNGSVLHRLLNGTCEPLDRTLYKVTRYLASRRTMQRKTRSAARPEATR
jgi:predicted transcriptional regulator